MLVEEEAKLIIKDDSKQEYVKPNNSVAEYTTVRTQRYLKEVFVLFFLLYVFGLIKVFFLKYRTKVKKLPLSYQMQSEINFLQKVLCSKTC
jgi:hypothetical protein